MFNRQWKARRTFHIYNFTVSEPNICVIDVSFCFHLSSENSLKGTKIVLKMDFFSLHHIHIPRAFRASKFLLCLLACHETFIFMYVGSISLSAPSRQPPPTSWRLKEWMKNVFIYRKKHKVGTKIYYAAALALIFYVNEQWRILFFTILPFPLLFLMTHSHQLKAIFSSRSFAP
jgi:hypothetical protein